MNRLLSKERGIVASRFMAKSKLYRKHRQLVSSSAGSISGDIPRIKPCDESLYRGVPLLHLMRGWTIYNVFRSDYLVANSIKIVKSMESTIGRPLTEAVLRASIFGHFGGEDTGEQLETKVEALTQRKMGVLFSYTSEQIDYTPTTKLSTEGHRELVEAKCNEVCRNYLKSIDYAARYTKGRPPLVGIKLSAIVDHSILDRLTSLLNYSDKVFMSLSTSSNPDHDLLNRRLSLKDAPCRSEAVCEALTKLADKNPTNETVDIVDWQNHFNVEKLDQLQLLLEEKLPGVERPAPLSQHKQQQLANLMKRLNDIGERAVTKRARLLVDAEQTYYQPAIRSFMVHYLMKKCNTKHPVVYDTVQSYLKSSHQTLLLSHATVKKNNSVYAVKLVRGAYMDEEARLAKEQGYENPVHDDKAATDASYHRNMNYLLSQSDTFVFMATHSNQSVIRTKEQMNTLNISPRSRRVMFGQLLGMADYVSSPLADNGYLVYKLLPYGKVREVVPYLARRALENRGAIESAQIERELLWKEITQRMFRR